MDKDFIEAVNYLLKNTPDDHFVCRYCGETKQVGCSCHFYIDFIQNLLHASDNETGRFEVKIYDNSLIYCANDNFASVLIDCFTFLIEYFPFEIENRNNFKYFVFEIGVIPEYQYILPEEFEMFKEIERIENLNLPAKEKADAIIQKYTNQLNK